LGYCVEDEFLYLAGRRDNPLKAGWHRINPQEIEDVIMESSMVVEAAVIAPIDMNTTSKQ
jgi:long-chain acyl-CoA synthetase